MQNLVNFFTFLIKWFANRKGFLAVAAIFPRYAQDFLQIDFVLLIQTLDQSAYSSCFALWQLISWLRSGWRIRVPVYQSQIHHGFNTSLGSYRKMAWKGFEPIATEFCLDALTDWDCYQVWVQLTSEPTLYSYFNVICSVLYLILAIDFVLAILAIVFIYYRISRSLGSWPWNFI